MLYYVHDHGAIAQLARASHWQCEGREFESLLLHHLQILKSSVKYDWTLCFYSDLWLYGKDLQQVSSFTIPRTENGLPSQKRVFE